MVLTHSHMPKGACMQLGLNFHASFKTFHLGVICHAICQSMSSSTQVMHSVPPPSAHPLARHSLGTCIRRACCVRQGDGAAQPRLTAWHLVAKFVGDVKLLDRNRQTPRPRRRLGEKGCELSERRTHRDEPKAACALKCRLLQQTMAPHWKLR